MGGIDWKASLKGVLAPAIAAVVIGGGVLWLVSSQHAAKPTPRSEPPIYNKAYVKPFDLKAGDCFELAPEETETGLIKTIPCDQPHTAQVYGSVALSQAPQQLPGDDFKLSDATRVSCADLDTSKVDQSKVPASAFAQQMVPNYTAWRDGARNALCVLQNAKPWSGSVLR